MDTKKIVTLVVLILCLAGGVIFNHMISSRKVVEAKTETKSEAPTTIDNPVAEADLKTNENVVADPNKVSQKIPILMYHHIRDFNDPTDPIGENLSVSPINFARELDYIVSQGYKTITFDAVLANNVPAKPVILTFDDGYDNFYQFAYPELKKRGMVAVSYVITGKIGGLYMTETQIKDVSANGFEIGSHTISHPDLSVISVEKARSEIFSSKQILENMIGKTVVSFCYPSGKYNAETIDLVKEAGYQYAVTTKSGTADFQSPFELKRFRMNKDTNIKNYLK